MIYFEKTEDFNPTFAAVSCIISARDRILFLLRRKNKDYPLTWGVPTGKVRTKENLDDAILREIREETSLILQKSDLNFLQTLYVRYPEYDFIYHLYKVKLNTVPDITVHSEEHISYRWVTLEEAFKLNLIRDMDKCLEIYIKKNIDE